MLPDQSVGVGGGHGVSHGGGVWQLVTVVGHHVSPGVTCHRVQVTRVQSARVKHDAVIILGAAPTVNAAILKKRIVREVRTKQRSARGGFNNIKEQCFIIY